MYNEVIKLIKQVTTVNEYGDSVVTETSREVFCCVKSITRSEFYQAEAVGMRPQIKFVLADYLDYNKEQVIEYKDPWGDTSRYSLLRTYKTESDELELIAKKGIE